MTETVTDVGRTAINLQSFCGTDKLRPYLMKPFTEGEFTFATNGHIMVRVPRIEGVGPIDRPTPINASALFERLGDQVEFSTPPHVILPAVSGPEIVDCSICDGRGKDHDCPDCECECDACDGTGKESCEKRVSTTLAGTIFALRYVRKMLELPSIEIAPETARANPGGRSLPLLFRFNGGFGVLMPRIGEAPDHIIIEQSADLTAAKGSASSRSTGEA